MEFQQYQPQYQPQYNIVDERPKTIRALARQALSGRWTEAFIFMIVVMAIEQIPALVLDSIPFGASLFGFLASVYRILIMGPLRMATAYYFIKLFRQKQGGLNDIQYGFDYAHKAIVMNLLIWIRIFLWSLLFVVPGIICAIRYSMANYLLADDPNKDPRQCMQESKDMMQGNKMNYAILTLSFIGWYIVASIPSGIVDSLLLSARGVLNTTDTALFYESLAEVSSSPLTLLASVPTLIVNLYMSTAYAAFYDLANGNLSVGGYDYAAAAGKVEDPFTGSDVSFKDVPTDYVPQEVPEEVPDTFEDPELKAAEEKYTTGDESDFE